LEQLKTINSKIQNKIKLDLFLKLMSLKNFIKLGTTCHKKFMAFEFLKIVKKTQKWLLLI
jgi:hypothetical protein